MVQFLSIIFFLDFFNFCWVFPKFPFFLCHPVIQLERCHALNITEVTHNKAVFPVLDPRTSSMSDCGSFRAERNRSFPPWMLRLYALFFVIPGRNLANDAAALCCAQN